MIQTAEQSVCPEPGVYPDVPAEEYHSWPAASKSRLWKLRTSPAHLRAYDLNPPKRSQAFKFGDAFDVAVFEPAEFDHKFTMARSCEAPLKSGARKGEPCGCVGVGVVGREWRCGKHGGDPNSTPEDQVVIPYDDMWLIRRMRESLKSHDDAMALLTGKGKNQLSVVWDDETTGVRCKARIDRLTSYEGYTTHVDLKSARSADPFGFRRDFEKFGYQIQCAHYRAGCEAIDRLEGRPARHRRFMFVVVEKGIDINDECRVEVFEPDESMIEAGLKVRDRLLAKYAHCLRTNEWPGRPRRIHTLYPSARLEQEANVGA